MKLPPAYRRPLLKTICLISFLTFSILYPARKTYAVDSCSISISPANGEEDTDFTATAECDADKNWALYWVETGQKINQGDRHTHPVRFDVVLGKGSDFGLGTHTIQLHCIWHLDFCKDKTAKFTVTSPDGAVPSEFCPDGFANTAIGKIECSPKGLAGAFFGLALGVAGGIALLLVIVGGYKVMASQGDPEALVEGKGMITRAIAGLLFIVFSAAILRIIGIQLLGLPGS